MSIIAVVFASEAEYLGAEWEWLRARVQRLASERTLQQSEIRQATGDLRTLGRRRQVSDEEVRRRLQHWRGKEEQLRAEIDVRLEAHRRAPVPRLGIDELCTEHGLSELERLALIVTALCATSSSMASDILDDVCSGFGSVTVEDLIRLGDPVGVPDWLNGRATFGLSGQLVRGQLVTVSFPGGALTPEDVLRGNVQITSSAFSKVTGLPPDEVATAKPTGTYVPDVPT